MKKIFTKSLAIVLIIFLLAPSARADFNWPSPSSTAKQMADAILSMFGLDKNEIQYASETFNESRQKKQAPQVSLVFEPVNPAPGEKITATAQPIYFMNDPKNLYFTWYIKHNTGATASTDKWGRKTKDGNTDLTGDGEINMEDYKVAAARIIANDDFEWDRDGDGIPDRDTYDSDSDDDGYAAVFGGDDQRDKEKHCYYHDNESGNEFEIDCKHLFPYAYYIDDQNDVYVRGDEDKDHNLDDDEFWNRVGKDSFGIREEAFWHTDPHNADTASTGNPDEANVVGLGINQFAWNYQPGDKVGVAVEGISTEPSQTDDSSYKTMWALPKNDCDIMEEEDLESGLTEDTETSDPTITLTDDGLGQCTRITTTITTKTQTRTLVNESSNFATIETKIIEKTTNTSTLVYDMDAATCETSSTNNHTPTNGSVTDDDYVEFNYPLADGEVLPLEDSSSISVAQESGNYDWNSGFMLSADSNYTYDDDNSFFTQKENADGDKISINRCLNDNFVDPTQGGSTNKIEVSLTASPTSPVNDPSGENSDTLVVQASAFNVKDPSYLKYAWQVFESDTPNPESWDQLLKSDMKSVNQTVGIGLSTFKLKMDMLNPQKYLKIKVRVSETTASEILREGHNDIVVPISSTTDQIHVHSAVTKGDFLELSDSERCTSGMDRVVCPVTKNEIIGVSVPGLASDSTILWTLDGTPIKPLIYTSGDCLSGECKPTDINDTEIGISTNIAYFPILKNNGEQYVVTLNADKNDGTKLNLTKTFEVVDPEIFLNCQDGTSDVCKPEYLGSYVDLNGVQWPDYSNTSFVGLAGETVSLTPKLNMPFLQNAEWFIDGLEAASLGAEVAEDGTLSFTANKLPGESYTIVYGGTYAQSPEIKKILNASFGVQLNEFYEKMVGSSVKLTMAESFDPDQVTKAPLKKKILASLVTDVPAYIGFLFRIILTVTLILFTSGLILSFASRPKEE